MKKGASTIELLIALAVLVMVYTAAVAVSFGGQVAGVDARTESEALTLARGDIEASHAASQADFASLVSVAPHVDDIYTIERGVTDISECSKLVTSTTTWSASPVRELSVALSSVFTSPAAAVATGGDCPAEEPEDEWDNPQRFAFDTLNPGKSTALDVLNKVAYLGQDKEPFLAIADTHGAVLDPNHAQPFFVTFANSFNSDGKILDQINDIDVYKDFSSGKVYALAATASSTAQFSIIDVSDIENPMLVAKRQLSDVDAGCNPSNPHCNPQGYQVHYHNGRAYVLTRETMGPELHIFNMVTPSNPVEIGKKEINTTVNDLAVRNGIAYLAAESDARGELLVYDVSNPIFSNPSSVFEITNASRNLPGNQNGASVYLLGNKLYVGRESVSSGPEMYILDASSPHTAVGGLGIVGSPQEIGTSVIVIRVVGHLAFLVTTKSKAEFQVWNISNPGSVAPIKRDYNFGNIIAGGMEYESNFIYATGNATPNFQILYSP